MINIQECTISDANILAEMNRQLIEDEKENSKIDLPQLIKRMVNFLNNEYKAFFIKNGNIIVGYFLCDMSKSPIYIRQFFIKREERRKHSGKEAFFELKNYFKIDEIELDVYTWNETGIKFWESLGFKRQLIRMKYKSLNYS
jgi:ribosomal protein S18 acetylase RimI-like enzyme